MSSGATVAVTGLSDRFGSWFAHHQRVMRSTWYELIANPVGSLMTWIVIGIALGLPAIMFAVLQNVSTLSGDWGGKPRVSLYLVEGTPVQEAQTYSLELNDDPKVDRALFISSEKALLDFQQRSGFGDVLKTLERNPLPHVIEVVPMEADPIVLSELVRSWEGNNKVERVSVDLQWLERLFAILVFAERLVTALAIVLALGVMLVMGNTIRLAIENRRQEIEIVKLVGGTDSFVRRPFLYLGFWYGLGGAVIALVLLESSLIFLAEPVEILAQSYQDDFALSGPGFLGYLILLVGGAVLGVIGSMIAVGRHLSEIEPT